MPSRSARCCSRLFGSALALFWATAAGATVTVEPVAPYESPNGNDVHYAALNSVTATIDTAAGFRDIDLTVGQVAGVGTVTADPGDGTGALLFDISCDGQCAAESGKNLLIFAVTSHTSVGGITQSIVPIGTVNGLSCSSSGNCQGFPTGFVQPSGVTFPAFAAQYAAQSTVRVGIYPKDVCASLSAMSRTKSDFCLSGQVLAPDGTNPLRTLDLSFYIFDVPTADTVLPEVTALENQFKAMTLNFYDKGGGTIGSCPSPTQDFYFPSDHSILLDVGNFFTIAETGQPPKHQILVFGNDNAAPNTAPDPFTGNELVQRVGVTGSRQVSGFKNSEPPSDLHPYQLQFAAINAAGVLSTVCTPAVTGVMATSVSGFLRAGNCFIATAAYRSPRAAGVERLRQLRDRVLRKSAVGRAFVSWYYSWSPGAAEWLLERPALRVPVLFALVPIQAVAWLLLQPALAACLALAGVAALGWAAVARFGRPA